MRGGKDIKMRRKRRRIAKKMGEKGRK